MAGAPFLQFQPARVRRTGLRLRVLIDEMKEEITANRRDLELQFQRIDHLQAQIDRLVEAWEANRKD